jgi:CDP-diglyceride synthetase
MDIFLALLAGSTAKIYDDCVDNKLITNEYHIKMLETLQCFLLGGLSINNFTFSIIASAITICNYIGGKGQYSNPYEFSLIAMYPIFIILSYSKREYLNLFDWILFLFLCGVLASEPILIKEDSSPRKLVIRFLYTVFFILTMPFYYKLLSNGVFLTLLYILGYVAVSVGFQIYACSHMSFDEFNKQLLSDVFKTFGIKKTATHPTGD